MLRPGGLSRPNLAVRIPALFDRPGRLRPHRPKPGTRLESSNKSPLKL